MTLVITVLTVITLIRRGDVVLSDASCVVFILRHEAVCKGDSVVVMDREVVPVFYYFC